VLPASVNNAQELELESVLQQQREHKDEYNLVSELMMIKKLHDQANMSDAQIARRLRISSGAKKVAEYRAMLDLMERARRLATESLPLSAFIREGDARNQRQNWLELLGRVKDIDAGAGGRPAGDDHIRRWLVAFHLGHDSVHRLRHAVGPWVERDVLADLAEGEGVPAAVAVAVATPVNATEAPPGALPPGLDLLGDEPTPTPSADAAAVRQLLDIAVAAKRAGDGDVTLPDGTNLPAGDVRDSLQASVGRGLDAVKRRASAGSRLSRPANVLAQARNNLSDAQDALDDVIDDPLFDSQRDNVSAVVDELTELLNGLSLTLGRGEVQLADNDAG
jgi:hypothetical protein